MKKKLIIIFSVLFICLIAYLFLAHHIIYKRISAAGLKPCDHIGEYIIGGARNEKSYNYTALGDSLTAGTGVLKYEESYPYQLAQKIAAKNGAIILRDRSYPGIRTEGVIKDLLAITINDKPDMITLLIGVNDVHGNVSKEKFTKNYKEILTRLKNETNAKIIAVNIPYIGTDSLLLPPFNSYFRHQTIEFNKIIKKLAQDHKIDYVDLYTPTARMFENSVYYATDSFHPSAKGYELWSKIIYDNIYNK
jgi:lysophospholipase L1-like esterase